jgi:hypothetical protein
VNASLCVSAVIYLVASNAHSAGTFATTNRTHPTFFHYFSPKPIFSHANSSVLTMESLAANIYLPLVLCLLPFKAHARSQRLNPV